MGEINKNNTASDLPDNLKLFGEIKLLIEQARMGVAIKVNQALTQLNWNIGDAIFHHILGESRAKYGKEILATVSRELSWSHFVELMALENEEQRMFYTQKAIEIARQKEELKKSNPSK